MRVIQNLVRIKEASERLGISIVSLHGKKGTKYTPFRHKIDGSKTVMFDIAGFEYRESLKEQLTEKTKLFIEYLYHIEKLNYAEQARVAKIDHQALYALNFGYKFAIKFMRMFALLKPLSIVRFDEYYGWETAAIKRRKLQS